MPHSFSYAVSMNLEHSIKEGSHERYPDHFQCFRNIKKIKYPDFQAMTVPLCTSDTILKNALSAPTAPVHSKSTIENFGKESKRFRDQLNV